MTYSGFNDGWSLRRIDNSSAEAVTLPHDAMIGETRSADAPSGVHGGYFPGGRYVYSRSLTAPSNANERHLELLFEGVQGDAVVCVDGVEVGKNISPYREFVVDLDNAVRPGHSHEIEVVVDNSHQPNSRWYTGSGIYRPVHLRDVGRTCFAQDGIRLHTRSLTTTTAQVELGIQLCQPSAEILTATVTFVRESTIAASTSASFDGQTATLTLEIPDPHHWSAESPDLYAVSVRLTADERLLDERELRFGLRTIELDPSRGLLVNGDPTLLRGACIHHDNGILGAATLTAADYRRARILKAQGYNAIRSSHNPASRALLDACDELGLYVLDELTDTWIDPKTPEDLSAQFSDLWEQDAHSMVAKDRNHACVIMYSLGNEIAETARPDGVEIAAALHRFVHALDPHRPTTVAVNFLLNVMATKGRSWFHTESGSGPSPATSTAANLIANKIGSVLQLVALLPIADRATRDVLAEVDVAGYNYGWSRYDRDAKRYPQRIVLGTESMPGELPRIWSRVKKLPRVIGDFTWTGFDYLGETGLGSWDYGPTAIGMNKPFPHIIAGVGTIDLIGHPTGEALLARAVWDLLPGPGIAVRPLDRAGQKLVRVAWRSTDAMTSWSWRGRESTRAEIEVYSADDEVELLLNGRSMGRKRTGHKARYVARFTAPYEPGELVAVGYRDGEPVSRSTLRSAGTPRLQLQAETDSLRADGQDTIFVEIQIADEVGEVEMLDDDDVVIELSGPATLAAFGSAAPATTESFTDTSHKTYYGRALAAIRSTTTAGSVTLTAHSTRHGNATVSFECTDEDC
ncbi:glycoside hydrolase family 2 TIM barrel-domain containing protein [Nocardia salmonicida]|uniref:glycoside hydrolase family 2 TIM barrel-domain containing protein n=1 Tax=Nocardia salmonicida TaxID=53431 RepID=UPI000ACC912D|nr:glycoside hydrolase family 2 TIM barrel-domain containing protein [Nocardia salmonicida]